MSYFRRLRDAAICVALLAIPFFFLRANLKEPERASVLDRWLLQASAPLQFVAAEAAGAVSGIVEDYALLVDVRRENDRLRDSNRALRGRLGELRGVAEENRRLVDLLGLREEVRGETLTARVIGKEISSLFRVVRIRLDRGERDQVKAGMPVLSSTGLVGQVRRTFGRYSDVLLTVDRTSAIDVVVRRTGARGMLRGTGESDRYRCRIQYLGRAEDVKLGDEVYTSGFGQRFPASILVGRVSKVEKKDFGLYQEVEVTPTVDFSTLQEVLVLTEGSRDAADDEGETTRR